MRKDDPAHTRKQGYSTGSFGVCDHDCPWLSLYALRKGEGERGERGGSNGEMDRENVGRREEDGLLLYCCRDRQSKEEKESGRVELEGRVEERRMHNRLLLPAENPLKC